MPNQQQCQLQQNGKYNKTNEKVTSINSSKIATAKFFAFADLCKKHSSEFLSDSAFTQVRGSYQMKECSTHLYSLYHVYQNWALNKLCPIWLVDCCASSSGRI